ncbi:hypothetical protein [Streptomyces sp. JJ38]|uniref:hypothetical protein n=1 Tax=Streptomyces sp. JJ38 TaxID=2738128 RepID=UPI001C57D314|nr:hypothetical protein [Streptomyces sp. JJ38]MBW1597888.1 hypothetical protein [Streptomyces sp. JJ38]
MSFDAEWAELRANAQERHNATRLNGLDGEGGYGGGQPDLVVHQDDLGAVGNAAFDLHGRFRKAADIQGAGRDGEGLSSTARAGLSLERHNFLSGRTLNITEATWKTKVDTLLQACAHISNHLDFSKKRHAEDEAHIEATMRHHHNKAVFSVSEIDKLIR